MQTKKRAKPVKFGKAARDAEKKVEAQVEEQAAAPEAVEPEQPAAPPAAAGPAQPPAGQQQGGELVDKLSDVPFETDFGVPSSQVGPAAPSVPAAPATPPAQAAPPQQEPVAPPEQHAQEEIKSDNIQPVPSAFDSSPNASSSSIPPIGRANEPIPFNPHETVFNTPPDAGEHKKNPFLYFLIIALVAFVTGIAFMAGIYYAMPNKNFFAMFSVPNMPGIPGVAQPSPTPEPVAKVQPTVTPEKEVKLSDYSVKVLNGSGVSGQAAKVKTALTAEGFTVASTGNADRTDVEKTQITYRKTVTSAALTKVKDVLKKSYVLDKETQLPSADSSSPDITITIGKQTAD